VSELNHGGPHESWCDTQNNISQTCNCMASYYIEEVDRLSAALKIARGALEKMERGSPHYLSFEQNLIEESYKKECRQALAKIKDLGEL